MGVRMAGVVAALVLLQVAGCGDGGGAGAGAADQSPTGAAVETAASPTIEAQWRRDVRGAVRRAIELYAAYGSAASAHFAAVRLHCDTIVVDGPCALALPEAKVQTSAASKWESFVDEEFYNLELRAPSDELANLVAAARVAQLEYGRQQIWNRWPPRMAAEGGRANEALAKGRGPEQEQAAATWERLRAELESSQDNALRALLAAIQ